MSLRVGVLVSGEGSNLQALIDTVHVEGVAEIVGVASNKPEARGLRRAESAGIATASFATADHASRADRDDALAAWLESLDVGLVVLAGFMELLGPEFVRRFAGRIVNVHPSLLPAFPGLAAIRQALEYGAKVTGVTVHFVDEGVDSGPIILQRPVDIPATRDPAELELAIHQVEHELLPAAVRLIAHGAVRPDPENRRVIRLNEEKHGRQLER